MKKIQDIINSILIPEAQLREAAQQRLDCLTKPKDSLGRLEELAKQVVSITGRVKPVIKNKVIFTLAADHGVTDEGVSAFPKEVTAQMVYNFLNNGAAINVLAGHVGARIVVADFGVATDLKDDPRLIKKKVNYGTRNMANEPAMTRDEALKSIRNGIEIFEEEYARGIDIVGTGEMGIGNTTASSAIAACFTGEGVSAVTGRGTGVDDKGLTNKVKIIEKALAVNRPNPRDPLDVLTKVGGYEVGGLVGVILAAASRRVPVVIDGFISGAAALVAYHLEPKTKYYMVAAHRSVEKGHRSILEHMDIRPILDLDLRLGEGTGAALGISVVEAAVKILNEMATFETAGVSAGAK